MGPRTKIPVIYTTAQHTTAHHTTKRQEGTQRTVAGSAASRKARRWRLALLEGWCCERTEEVCCCRSKAARRRRCASTRRRWRSLRRMKNVSEKMIIKQKHMSTRSSETLLGLFMDLRFCEVVVLLVVEEDDDATVSGEGGASEAVSSSLSCCCCCCASMYCDIDMWFMEDIAVVCFFVCKSVNNMERLCLLVYSRHGSVLVGRR